jgi:hypothetical protein
LPAAEINNGMGGSFQDSSEYGAMPPSTLAWQWNDALNLDPTFSIDDLCNFDLSAADPVVSASWHELLRSSGELSAPPMQPASAPINSLQPQEQPQARPQWFTHIAQPAHRLGESVQSSSAQDPTAVSDGEISRDALASSLILRQPAPNSTLPSARLLNRWIHIFTTRLWPVIPIVHLPTFQPARTHPLLLLSICSLGALADGSEQALYYAEKLFEGVQKAILVAFAPDKALDEHSLARLQAAVIGQTFALLSGRPEHLMTAQAFHGTLFLITRKFYATIFGFGPPPDLAPRNPQVKDWGPWVTAQILVRTLNAVQVHNGEVAATTSQPAFHRTQPLSIPVAAQDDLFLAKTANEWASLSRAHSAGLSAFRSVSASLAILECFVGEISHARCSSFHIMSEQHMDEYKLALHAWFLESADSFKADRVQRLTVLSLWHSCFLLLLGNLNLMEKACGRDACPISPAENQELRAWMLTSHAKQCVAHAALMCRLTNEARISDIPAIHMARSLWHAGLVLAVYSSLASAHPSGVHLPPAEHCPGIQALHQTGLLMTQDLKALEDDATPTRCSTLASSISTTLRHLGPWPIATRYATTLDQVMALKINTVD